MSACEQLTGGNKNISLLIEGLEGTSAAAQVAMVHGRHNEYEGNAELDNAG